MRTALRCLLSGAAACIVRITLGLVFVVAAVGKIADPARFADGVAAYRLLPAQAVNLFAITLPWVELLCGLALINGVALRSSAALVALMNVAFIVAVGSAMIRGLNIQECGCASVVKSKPDGGLIARDVLFLAMSLLVLLRPVGRQPSAISR